jgi:hypothetical protein
MPLTVSPYTQFITAFLALELFVYRKMQCREIANDLMLEIGYPNERKG